MDHLTDNTPDGLPFELQQGTDYTYSEILQTVEIHKDVIITIWPQQVDTLKKGLAVRKSKQKKKLEGQGIVQDEEFLSFNAYTSKTIKGAVDVRIKLAPRSSITVLGLNVPDDEL